MDGNGRWATSKDLSRSEGHRAGTKAARRPQEEISFLFGLLKEFLTKELPSLIEEGIRLRVLGEMDELPFATRTVLGHVMSKTSGGTAMTLNLALNYSGRDEIVRAARRLVEDGIPASEVTEQTLGERLYTGDQPDPDLVVRTSGEYRISNYLLFQIAYSELYFTDVCWPDFDTNELHKALTEFAGRKRRFGKTGEQIRQND